MKNCVFLICMLAILFSGNTIYAQSSADNIFEQIINNIERKDRIQEMGDEVLRLQKSIEPVQWEGQIYSAEYIIFSGSRKALNKYYGDDLIDLFRDFLTRKGWTVTHLGTDHWGQAVYRRLDSANKKGITFSFVFSAENRYDDWDGKIYILSDNPVSTREDKKVDFFEGFFENVLNLINTPGQPIDLKSDLFRISGHKDLDLDGLKLKVKMTFYCQFGPNSTKNAMRCYEEMPNIWINYLEAKGFVVEKILDKSLTGWTRTLYLATHNKETNFKFLFESESVRSMGYTKIHIVKK